MGLFTSSISCFLFRLLFLVIAEGKTLHGSDFPANFYFGASSSSYQYEGAAFEDGKGLGIWDMYTHEGNARDRSTGDITSDGYHRYKDDVKILSDTGFNAFRLSISWPRLIPDGRGAINPKGLNFYNSFINELLAHDIEPFVTLNHFDLPQALEDEYEGWINSRIVDDFLAFTEVCFREFGDRVKYWITINEPNAFGELGYSEGLLAPKRCSLPSMHCKTGNSSAEPYLAVHNMMLAHAAAVKLYRTQFQKRQEGSIGIAILAYWYWPVNNETVNSVACQRAIDFHIGWILDPLVFGRYPEVMRRVVANRLPSFTISQSKDLLRSFDFIALNHYSTLYVYDKPRKRAPPVDYATDMSVRIKAAGKTTGIPAKMNMGFGSAPLGFQNVLEYMQQHYGNPPIFVTECGVPETSNSSIPVSKSMNDTARVSYFAGYVKHMLHAIRKGSKTRGFFAWSFVDGFEYAFGYTVRFGLYYVRLADDLSRKAKLSAKWFQRMLLPKQQLEYRHNFSSQAVWI